jgi:hypothetical protein
VQAVPILPVAVTLVQMARFVLFGLDLLEHSQVPV